MAQQNKVLIIEDSHLMRLQLKYILEQVHFDVMELDNANELFSAGWRYKDIGAILLDIHLPGMDGLAVLRKMNADQSITWPPVIIVSSSSDKDTIKAALMLGARDYIVKPVQPDILIQKLQHIYHSSAASDFRLRYLALVAIVKDAYQLYVARECKYLPKSTVITLAKECEKIVRSNGAMILFRKEYDMIDYSFGHALNVAIVSGLIATWMGLKENEIQEMILSGLLHDLGKARIPCDLILKTAKLSEDEMDIIKTHPTESYNLIKDEDFSQTIRLGVIQHHERMDGSGYPKGLSGKEISLAARIIAVADVYDAMTSDKVYRQAETPFVVIEEVFREMFGKLDPYICSVFLKNLKERLVGQKVRLLDGSEAEVKRIDGDGFGKPVLEDARGRLIELTEALSFVG